MQETNQTPAAVTAEAEPMEGVVSALADPNEATQVTAKLPHAAEATVMESEVCLGNRVLLYEVHYVLRV